MGLWRLLFPGVCMLCRRRSRRDIDLCPACESAFVSNEPACRRCAEPLPAGATDALCGACIATPPPWTKAVAPFIYSQPLTRVVEGLKFGNGLMQARVLGTLLTRSVKASYLHEPLPDALVPLPLTRKRRRQRGFNQAELLANVVGRGLALPRERRYLVRVKDSAPQRTLPRAARLRNVRGVFKARPRPVPPRLALIDDVTTTGATVRAATQAMLDGGAQEVHVWTVAKTPASY